MAVRVIVIRTFDARRSAENPCIVTASTLVHIRASYRMPDASAFRLRRDRPTIRQAQKQLVLSMNMLLLQLVWINFCGNGIVFILM